MKEDGTKKNDCERNASERLLKDFRREHPHLSVIIVEDALSSNGPHLKLLKELNMSFITVIKPDGNKSLFEWVEGFDWGEDLSKRDESQGEFSFCHQTDPLTGNQIAFIRHYFEMTGKEFGRKFGVTQACVSKWEARGNESAKMDAATEVCVKIYVFESLHQEIELIVKKQLLDRDLQRKSKIHELKPTPISIKEEDIKECMYG